MTDPSTNTDAPLVEEKTTVTPDANLAVYFKNISVSVDSGYLRYLSPP
jgi:hypothetical protein